MFKKSFFALCSLLILANAHAMTTDNLDADPAVSPYYYSLFGGSAIVVPFSANDATGTRVYRSNGSWYNVGASLGYQFTNNFRAELSAAHIYTKGRTLKYGNVNATQIGGSTTLVPVMINGLYDFNISPVLVPYVGFGLGVAHYDENTESGNTNYQLKGTTNLFAYQGIVGLGYKIGSQLTIGLEYRFIGTSSAHLKAYDSAGNGHSIRDNFMAHMIDASIRYQFAK